MIIVDVRDCEAISGVVHADMRGANQRPGCTSAIPNLVIFFSPHPFVSVFFFPQEIISFSKSSFILV